MDETTLAQMFADRLLQLRCQLNISARDMSLSLGLNAGYINNIEIGKSLPSMGTFFLICDYLNIEPREFFDYETVQPVELREVIDNLKKLNPKQFSNITSIIEDLAKLR